MITAEEDLRRHRLAYKRRCDADPEYRARAAAYMRARRADPERYKAQKARWVELSNRPGHKELARLRTRTWQRKRVEGLAGRPRPIHCDVCGALPGKHALHFDHDHATGEFRGWLCSGCNLALGHVNDDIEILDALIVYLSRSRRPKLVVNK